MDIPSGLFPSVVQWLAWVIFIFITLQAFFALDWRRLASPADGNVWFFATLLVALLWLLKGGISPGLGFHILGVTTLALMFGAAFSWVSVCLITLGTSLYGLGSLDTIALNAILMGWVSIHITLGLLKLCQRYLPHHFFIYIFVNAFFAAGISSLISKVLVVIFLLVMGQGDYATIAYEYLPYFPMMFISEALVNGMAMTMLVSLRPQWVCTFDDARYLHGK